MVLLRGSTEGEGKLGGAHLGRVVVHNVASAGVLHPRQSKLVQLVSHIFKRRLPITSSRNTPNTIPREGQERSLLLGDLERQERSRFKGGAVIVRRAVVGVVKHMHGIWGRPPRSNRAKRSRRGADVTLQDVSNSGMGRRHIVGGGGIETEGSRRMIWGWRTDGQVIRDGVGAVRTEESDARERVVREVACSARFRPDADRIDIGEGGGPAKVTDKEAIRDLALMVKAHDGPHGGEVDLFLAVGVDAAHVPDLGQRRNGEVLLPVLEGEADSSDLGVDVVVGDEAVLGFFVALQGDGVAVVGDGRHGDDALARRRGVEHNDPDATRTSSHMERGRATALLHSYADEEERAADWICQLDVGVDLGLLVVAITDVDLCDRAPRYVGTAGPRGQGHWRWGRGHRRTPAALTMDGGADALTGGSNSNHG
jgi:hypothetical protein